MSGTDGRRSHRGIGRRDALRAVGGAVGLGSVLGAVSRRASAVAPSTSIALSGRYVGSLNGALTYRDGGAGGVREATDASVTHAVEVVVIDRQGERGTIGTNPVDVALITTPELTVPREGDVNVVTGFAGDSASHFDEGARYWLVEYDPVGGSISGHLGAGGGINDLWAWWFGYPPIVVPSPLAPPSTFRGVLSAESLHLELYLVDWGVEHELRGTVDATRVA